MNIIESINESNIESIIELQGMSASYYHSMSNIYACRDNYS